MIKQHKELINYLRGKARKGEIGAGSMWGKVVGSDDKGQRTVDYTQPCCMVGHMLDYIGITPEEWYNGTEKHKRNKRIGDALQMNDWQRAQFGRFDMGILTGTNDHVTPKAAIKQLAKIFDEMEDGKYADGEHDTIYAPTGEL